MFSRNPQYRWIGVLLSLTAVFFRAMEIVITRDLRGSLDVIQVTFWRFTLGLFLLVVILHLIRAPVTLLPTSHSRLFWMRNLTGIGAQLSFSLGLPFLSVGVATALFYLHPVMITVGAVWIYKYRVRILSWFAVLIGTAGAIILAAPTQSNVHWAILIIIAGAGLAATSDLVLNKLSLLGHQSIEMAVTYFFAGSVITGPMLLLAGRWPNFSEIKGLMVMAIFGLLFQYLHYQSFRFADPASLSPIKPTALAWNALIDIFVYNTTIPTLQLVGMVLIGAGAALAGVSRNSEGK